MSKTDNSNPKEIFKDLIFTVKETEIIESVFRKATYKKGTQLRHVKDAAARSELHEGVP